MTDQAGSSPVGLGAFGAIRIGSRRYQGGCLLVVPQELATSRSEKQEGAMAMRGVKLALITAIMLVWSAVASMALTPVKVIDGPAYWPSSNGTYLAWTSNATNRSNVYVTELPNGTPERVNPAGTGAEQASFVGSSNVLVYDQWTVGSQGDIFFYDVSTGTRTEAPAAVNKPRTFEWAAMASDNYLLFMRHKWSSSGTLLRRWLLLYDRNSGAMTTLETGDSYYRPTFAGTTYVAWFVCGSVACTLHYWSASGGEQVQPTAGGKDQYAGWIDETMGQIYLVRSGHACGKKVTIRRADLGSSASIILSTLPRGIDAGEMMSVAPNPATSHQDLYFQRWSCRNETGDIYALEGVDTV